MWALIVYSKLCGIPCTPIAIVSNEYREPVAMTISECLEHRSFNNHYYTYWKNIDGGVWILCQEIEE